MMLITHKEARKWAAEVSSRVCGGKTAEGAKVSLLAHSAGGWLARLYLGENGTQDVELLLTLGSPHL